MPMLGQTRTFERYDPCKVYEDAVMVVWPKVQPPVVSSFFIHEGKSVRFAGTLCQWMEA